MKPMITVCIRLAVVLMFIFPRAGLSQDSTEKILPLPRMEGGMPLMEALKARKSGRSYDTEKMLSDQVLSDLLWAGFGINRPDTGQRTAPSAMNWQDLEIYVILAQGAYVYDAKDNKLKLVAAKDLRELTGGQPFVKTAPVNLAFVSDYAKMKAGEENNKLMAWNHAGYVSQNIYLFCASEGLSTVVRSGVSKEGRDALAKELNLRPEQHISTFQTIGYPK